jgi:carbon-monoxide dehydrogenase medium subunit
MLAVHRSRKLIPDFTLLRPRTIEEAAALQARAPETSAFLAGGIDVINRLKFGAPITTLIHLGAVPGLADIAETADGLLIGACVTHDQLQTSALVRARLPALTETWSGVANIRIRLKGTLGGNLMAREPAYDFALAVMAAGAILRFVGADGAMRRVAAAALTDAGGRPVPQFGLLTAIELPTRGLRLSFDRSLRPALSLALGEDARGGRVAIGCAFAAPLARELAAGDTQADVARATAASLPEPMSDMHAGGAYRRRMIELLLRRRLEVVRAAA